MSCKCPPPTTGGAAGELVAAPYDPDHNAGFSTDIYCPPGTEWNGIDCLPPTVIVQADPPVPVPGPSATHYRRSDLPAPNGNGNGAATDYTPEEQPFPWVALLVGVGAVLLAARR